MAVESAYKLAARACHEQGDWQLSLQMLVWFVEDLRSNSNPTPLLGSGAASRGDGITPGGGVTEEMKHRSRTPTRKKSRDDKGAVLFSFVVSSLLKAKQASA